MNRRERVLAIVTVVVIGLLLAYQFVFSGMVESAGGGGGDLSAARATLRQNLKTIGDAPTIEKNYHAFEVEIPERIPGQTSWQTFSNELAGMLQGLGARNPDIAPPGYDLIPNVPDYFFVEIEVRLSGTQAEMIRLMRDMDQRGLLIKKFSLNLRGPDKVDLTIVVRRLVKHDEDSRKWVKGKK